MFIELFFATVLDMSLPEFQPQEDLSGNVIVSSIDEESDEIIAEEILLDEIPIVNPSELPPGITPGAEGPTDLLSVFHQEEFLQQ